jgi:hypothetical protein
LLAHDGSAQPLRVIGIDEHRCGHAHAAVKRRLSLDLVSFKTIVTRAFRRRLADRSAGRFVGLWLRHLHIDVMDWSA